VNPKINISKRKSKRKSDKKFISFFDPFVKDKEVFLSND
jgi:hypothetical protein